MCASGDESNSGKKHERQMPYLLYSQNPRNSILFPDSVKYPWDSKLSLVGSYCSRILDPFVSLSLGATVHLLLNDLFGVQVLGYQYGKKLETLKDRGIWSMKDLINLNGKTK